MNNLLQVDAPVLAIEIRDVAYNYTLYVEYISSIKTKRKKQKKKFIKELKKISFFDINLFDTQHVDNKLFDIMTTLDRLKSNILKELGCKINELHSKPLQRKISPKDTSAYEYQYEYDQVDHSKLASYGLLFGNR